MTFAQHYIHQVKMKKQGNIKNKVMVQFVVASVSKTSQIPHTNVIPFTFEGDDGDNVRRCEVNTILVLLTRSMPLSPSTQVALANGQCKATFASIKLLFY
jgi:hypothetical protein